MLQEGKRNICRKVRALIGTLGKGTRMEGKGEVRGS